MEKILVTTDLSANSASALRFAHKLCLLRGATMVVLYVDELPIPTGWSLYEIETYKQQRKKLTSDRVAVFVDRICRSLKKPAVSTQIEVLSSTNAVKAILAALTLLECSYICISTRGAGKVKRLLGTHTSRLMASSPVPVICVPSSYRTAKIKRVCYASDLTAYEREIKKVFLFCEPFGARIELLHITRPVSELQDSHHLAQSIMESTGQEITVHLVKRNIANTLHQDIGLAIENLRPSMAVFFNHPSHSFLDQLFHPSAAQYESFVAKIPILSFRKIELMAPYD